MITTGQFRQACQQAVADMEHDPGLLARHRSGDNIFRQYGISDDELDEFAQRLRRLLLDAQAHVATLTGHSEKLREFRRDPLGSLAAAGADTSVLDEEAARQFADRVEHLGSIGCRSCEIAVGIALVALGGAAAAVLLILATTTSTIVAVALVLLSAIPGGAALTAAVLIAVVGGVVSLIAGLGGITITVALGIAEAVVEDLPHALCVTMKQCEDDDDKVPLDPEISRWDGVDLVEPWEGGAAPATGDLSIVAVNGRWVMAYPIHAGRIEWSYTFRDVWMVAVAVMVGEESYQTTRVERVGLTAYENKVYMALPSSQPNRVEILTIDVPAAPDNQDQIPVEHDPWKAPAVWNRSIDASLGQVEPSSGIAVAFFEGSMYLAMTDGNDKDRLKVFVQEESGFKALSIPSDPRSVTAPSLVVHQDQLWVFFVQHHEKHVQFTKYNGASWTKPAGVRPQAHGVGTPSSVAVTAFEEKLYIFLRAKHHHNVKWVVGETGKWVGGQPLEFNPVRQDAGAGEDGGPTVTRPESQFGPGTASRPGTPEFPDTGRIVLVYAEMKSDQFSGESDLPFWSLD